MGARSAGYEPPERPRGALIAELAASQHGVVSVLQLYAAGYTKSTIKRQVALGHLHRVHPGVYAVGHRRLTLRGHWMAAVLACGSGAVLSHRAAASLWDLRRSDSGRIDVTGDRRRHGVAGVRLHRVRSLHPDDIAIRDNIRVTTVARTLLDLAEVLRSQQLGLTMESAERQDLLDGRAVEAMLARATGRHGIKPFRQALQNLTGPAPWTQSQLEDAFLVLVREAMLPEPQCNVIVCGELVDCYWPQPPLVVELDGYSFHKDRRSFETDRRRANKLQLNGIPVVRFTPSRVENEPHAVVAEVTEMLHERRLLPRRAHR